MASGWTYEIYPTDSTTQQIQTIQTRVEIGQTITISWSAANGWESQTNRYLWRCIGAVLDGSGSGYAFKTMNKIGGQSGQETHTVTTAGNILFGGYSNGLHNNSFLGKYIKVLISNPT